MTAPQTVNGRPSLGRRRIVGGRLEAARRRTDALRRRLLGPRRRGSAVTETAGREEPQTEELVRSTLVELRAERREILEPLLRRLTDLGERLSEGQEIPAPILEDGLSLWQAYQERLHAAHVSRFLSVRASVPHVDSCMLALAQLQDDPVHGAARVSEVRTVLSGYERKPGLYRSLLGEVLVAVARAELAWEGFEEDFAGSCLPAHLAPAALAEWNSALVEGRARALEIREAIRAFLSRTDRFSRSALAPRTPSHG
ncbi:MAG: hypothetical protein QXG65_04535 [Thermoplasmata archaeon]